ncbi:MAG: hypothetical protein ACI4FZ_06990 [Lachnospiraceae bacterium]
MKHKKWVLAVTKEDYSKYEVTDIMSESVEKILPYVDYLNRGLETGIPADMRKQLDELKEAYAAKM